MPLFTGVITFPKFVELHPYCLEHKCCLDRGKIGNEFDEIDGWVCPRRPDRANLDYKAEVSELGIPLPQIPCTEGSTPLPVPERHCRALRRKPSATGRCELGKKALQGREA